MNATSQARASCTKTAYLLLVPTMLAHGPLVNLTFSSQLTPAETYLDFTKEAWHA